MSRSVFTPLLLSSAVVAHAQVANEPPVQLEPVTVYSPTVANQEPVASYATPVTALRYEPLVDVQARNFAEGQADVSIRGGTFENSGFSLGAVRIYDPQTGHYFAELPVAPAMLGAPTIRTGANNAINGWSSTAGSVAYGWLPIRSGGFVSAGAGDDELIRGEVYAGYEAPKPVLGRTLAADVSFAASDGNGSREFGYHDFERYAARLQLRDDVSQTDVVAGHQDKELSWRNMYTPFGVQEIDHVRTDLFLVNHRVEIGADGDFFQTGAYARENRDTFLIPTFPAASRLSRHSTEVYGTSFDGRWTAVENTALIYSGGVVADDLDSSRLTFGRFNSRTQYYAGLVGEQTIPLSDTRAVVLSAGTRFDDSDRDDYEWSPVAIAELRNTRGVLRKVYVSYDETTQLPTYQALNAKPTPGGVLFIGNPNQPRATSENVEAGVELGFDQWQGRAAVFARRDNDLLDYIYNPAVFTVARRAVSGDVDTVGFEAVVRRNWERFDVVFGYTFLDKDADYLTPGDTSIYALNYAEHRLTAALVARLGGGLEVRMDNEARIEAESAFRRRNDEVILSSLGLYCPIPGVKGLTVNAQVDNLWNTYFEDVPGVPGARRQLSAGARYAW